jgi:hypothetical protein
MLNSFSAARTTAVQAALALLCTAAISACGGNGSGDSPTGPSPTNTNLTGTWTGTLSRPGTLGPISIRWIATQAAGDFRLSGPLSMTYNGVTINTILGGTVGGGRDSTTGNVTPITVAFTIALVQGGAPGFPACSINSRNSPQFTGLPTAPTTLTTSLEMQYSTCQGFIPPDGNTNERIETTTLTMNKQ